VATLKLSSFIKTKLNNGLLGPSNELSGPDWLHNDRHIQRFGYSVVAIFVVVFIFWGGVAPLESAALAPGVVQVKGKRKAVQHLEGGIVASILVNNGDKVTQGQELVLMDTTQAGAELLVSEGRRYTLLALVDRLTTERDDVDSIAFSPLLERAALTDERARAAMAGEVALFNARRASRRGEVDVYVERESQLLQQIAGLTALKNSSESVATSIEQEVHDLQDLLAEGYVDKQRLRELERSRSRVLGELTETEAQIAAAKVRISELRLEILQLEKVFKAEVVNLLNEALSELYEVEQQYTTIQDRVHRAIIRAPATGYVLGLQTTTVGAVISRGQELMQIVPSVDQLTVEAKVSPMDIDRLRLGLPAEIRFSVFKDAYMVSGTLANLSADRLIDENSDQPYYAADIEILPEDLALLGDAKLIPGMPAEVIIKTGERTMLGYITSPLNRLFANSLTED